jgi:hypothetical protein
VEAGNNRNVVRGLHLQEVAMNMCREPGIQDGDLGHVDHDIVNPAERAGLPISVPNAGVPIMLGDGELVEVGRNPLPKRIIVFLRMRLSKINTPIARHAGIQIRQQDR